MERKRIEDRIERLRRTLEAREAIRRGDRQAILVPGRSYPATITDAEAQAYADENFGIEWERKDDKVIVWCEM